MASLARAVQFSSSRTTDGGVTMAISDRPGAGDDELAALVTRVVGAPVEVAGLRRLRAELGGLRAAVRLRSAEVAARVGLPPEAVERLRDALDVARAAWLEADERPRFRGAREVFEGFSALSTVACEELWVLVLDGANRMVARERVGSGDASRVPATPAQVLAPCVRLGAVRVILVHNHPSGIAIPSRDDVAFTRGVVRAGRLLGIAVLDHVVIGSGEFSSLRDGALVPFAE